MTTFSAFWFVTGIAANVLFWAAIVLVILCVRQKRYLYLLYDLLALLLCYFLVQCIAARTSDGFKHATVLSVFAESFVSLPKWLITLLIAALTAVMVLLFRNHRRFEKTQITLMSVKEATDSLPSGLCFYLPSGQLLMKNLAMDRFCLAATGDSLISGDQLRRQLFAGALADGREMKMIGGTPIIRLPDGTSWSVAERESPFEETTAHMLLVTDVTEQMQKIRSLRDLQRKLTALNEQLVIYNREIVSLTAERELLAARVRLHDEMGADLLTIRRYIESGGTPKDQADIEARLRRNLNFLMTGQASLARDEYELMLETAEKLGVRVVVTGELPPKDPQKHVVATAIHECLTNTLRHAHGDELTIAAVEREESFVITFSNNGDQPVEPIREKGGLSSLRKLAENAGGSLLISAAPTFSVTLTLPKEVPNVLL